jgi:hypothetical protein
MMGTQMRMARRSKLLKLKPQARERGVKGDE